MLKILQARLQQYVNHELPDGQAGFRKGFGIVNKAEIDVFLELSCIFDDPADVGNLICGFLCLYKTSLNIRNITVHLLLKPGLENFEHYLLACEMSAIVW